MEDKQTKLPALKMIYIIILKYEGGKKTNLSNFEEQYSFKDFFIHFRERAQSGGAEGVRTSSILCAKHGV